MTQEQFQRAVEINNRLEDLKEVKRCIANTSEHRLYYAYKCSNGDYHCCPDWGMRPISNILDKHDVMIRQEIEDEIVLLKREIETL